MPAYYLVKWITWKEKKTPIITQSENGPCPLLAIMNTLFLRWKVRITIIYRAERQVNVHLHPAAAHKSKDKLHYAGTQTPASEPSGSQGRCFLFASSW